MTTRARHQSPPNPNGCQHCGVEERDHMQRWSKDAGWHTWVPPTQAQRLARMLARRANRKTT